MTFPLTDPVDYCLVGGEQTPGYAYPEGAALLFAWEEKKGHGFDGSGLVLTGKDLSSFNLIIELVSDQDWSDWYNFKAVLSTPPSPNNPKSLAFWHPFTAELGIESVIVHAIEQPKKVVDTGVWQVVIKLQEYRPPKKKPPAKASGTGSSGSARQGTTTVDDPQDARIRELTGQVQDLA